MKGKLQDNSQFVKAYRDIKIKKIEHLIHAAYFCGFLSAKDGLTADSPKNSYEISMLKELILKDI